VPSLSGVTADLLPVNAPKDSLTSINSIYDKRAAAYRDRIPDRDGTAGDERWNGLARGLYEPARPCLFLETVE
jgi:hypothetical protein